MIELTRFDDSQLIVNADMILFIAKTPDTVITLLSDKKIIVKESVEEVVEKVFEYKRQLLQGKGWR